MCETKPICLAVRVPNKANRAKRSQFEQPGCDPAGDCAERSQFHRSARIPEEEMCKTNPICPRPACQTKQSVRNEARLARRSGCQNQSCKTKPIWRRGLSCKTNPISTQGGRPPPHAAGTTRAKQSQFGEAWLVSGANCAKRSQSAILGATRWTRYPPPYAGHSGGGNCGKTLSGMGSPLLAYKENRFLEDLVIYG